MVPLQSSQSIGCEERTTNTHSVFINATDGVLAGLLVGTKVEADVVSVSFVDFALMTELLHLVTALVFDGIKASAPISEPPFVDRPSICSTGYWAGLRS